MLFCDNCNGGYHLFYLKLELTQILIGIWYYSSCSLAAPWNLFKPCHTFQLRFGGDTWNFHFNLLLCIVYICVCIFFWLIGFYLWLVLIFLFNKVYYGLHLYNTKCHGTTHHDSYHARMHGLIHDSRLRAC
jgi:hypothetical protein